MIIGALALFFAYAWLPLSSSGILSSPDEAAVAYFAENGLVTPAHYPELGNLVHPRSVIVVDGNYVPSSWVGLPFILRSLKSIGVGIEWSELLIPLIAVLAVFAWGSVAAKWTKDNRLGVIAGVLLAIHPGWWHYTARGLHANVLFISCLIFALWFWTRACKCERGRATQGVIARSSTTRQSVWHRLLRMTRNDKVGLFLGGLCIGLALFARANEAVWVIPVLVCAAVMLRSHYKRLIVAVAGLLIPLIIMGFVHASLYGDPLYAGYNLQGDAIPGISSSIQYTEDSNTGIPFQEIRRAVLPFGFHEMNIVRNSWNFHFAFFWPWTILFLLGGFVLIVRWKQGKLSQVEKKFLVFGGLISLYLFLEYGSWNFRDNPDPSDITLGTSYIRYWFPVTVWMTGVGAYFLRYFEEVFPLKGKGKIIVTKGLVLLMVLSVYMTVYGQDEGFKSLTRASERSVVERTWIIDQTDLDDILIVDRSDKYVFPHRAVRVPLRDELTYTALRTMYDATADRDASLWYFGLTLPMQDFEYLREVKLLPHDLDISEVESFEGKTLYRIQQGASGE